MDRLLRSPVPMLFVLCALSTGCASLPKTGVPPTGDPLWVKTELVDDSYVTAVKVGDVEHRDASGRLVGSSSAYENRVVQQTRTDWYLMQGGHAVDAQDFFRIAGDERVASDIESTRARGLLLNRGGWGLVATGAAMVLGGYAAMYNSDTAGLAAPMIYGGLFGAGGGYLLTWWGSSQMQYDADVTPAQAQVAADAYNARINAAAPGDAPARSLPPPSAHLLPRSPVHLR